MKETVDLPFKGGDAELGLEPELLAASAMTSGMTNMNMGGGVTMSVSVDPWAGVDAMLKEFKATQVGADHAYMLAGESTADVGKPTLVRIRKRDAKVVGEAVLGDKTPDYRVDEAHDQVIVVTDKHTIACYPFVE